MKKMLFLLLAIGLIQTISFGEVALELDLFKCTLNGCPLLESRSGDRDIEALIGEPSGISRDMYNECDVYYFKKGLVLSYSSVQTVDSVTLYLYNAYYFEGYRFTPFNGKINFGITGETTIEELEKYFTGYIQKNIYIDEYNNYILIDLKEHYLFAYFDSKTHKLKKIVLKDRKAGEVGGLERL